MAHWEEIFQYDTQRNGKLMLSEPEAIMISVSPEISEDFVLITGTGKAQDDQSWRNWLRTATTVQGLPLSMFFFLWERGVYKDAKVFKCIFLKL